MKKLLSLALATVMALSLTAVAFADEEAALTDVSSVTVTKTVEGDGLETETFSFSVSCTEVTNAADDVDVESYVIKGFEITVEADESTGSATITLPMYESVGVYTYKIVEDASKTYGVTDDTTAIYLVVTVTNGENGSFVRSVAVHQNSATGDKVDATEGEGVSINFTNTYESGTLSVTKEVTGNLGDKSKEFTVTVVFSAVKDSEINSVISYTDGDEEKTIAVDAWSVGSQGYYYTTSVVITLKDGETVTFENIPASVTYTVTESDYTSEGYDAATYTYSDENQTISADDKDTVTITNNKEQTVDTGINLDTLPYVMMLAVVAVAAIALMMKKRNID